MEEVEGEKEEGEGQENNKEVKEEQRMQSKPVPRPLTRRKVVEFVSV